MMQRELRLRGRALRVAACWVVAAALAVAGMGSWVGCEAPASQDSAPRMEGLVEGVISPGYEALAESVGGLSQASQALCAGPDAQGLAAAQATWSVARARWKEADAFYFGPAKVARARVSFDWTTLSPEKVEALIAGDGLLTAEALAQAPADAGGLLAVEYLLFDGDRAEGEALAAFVRDSAGGGRRCGYLLGVVGALDAQAAAIVTAWSPTREDFGAELTSAGKGSVAYATAREAVSEVVNSLIFTVEDAANLYLGVALRLDGAATLDPTTLPSYRSGGSLEDVAAALRGAYAVYIGGWQGRGGEGVSAWVVDRAPDVDARILLRFAQAQEAVAALSGPLSEVVVKNPAGVQAAFDAIKALQTALEADLSPLLGVSLTFNDNDGD
jgi:uncharacterized protein